MTKFCECGCGQVTPAASRTDTRKGWVKGQPKRFARNHNGRMRPRVPCACGCGELTRRGKRYVHGHAPNSRRGAFARGRFVDPEGYVRIFVGREHPMAFSTGYAFEHRIVMASALGRVLERREVVHHLNGVRDDNRLTNLALFESPTEHNVYHAEQRRVAAR